MVAQSDSESGRRMGGVEAFKSASKIDSLLQYAPKKGAAREQAVYFCCQHPFAGVFFFVFQSVYSKSVFPKCCSFVDSSSR